MSSESTTSTKSVGTHSQSKSAVDRKLQLRWILVTFVVIVLVDQASKAIIMATIEKDRSIQPEVFFQFTHQRNEGLVGGMLSGFPILTKILPVAATCVLIFLFRYLDPAARLQSLAFGLVAGGAIGNLIDRVRFGSVTDFLQFHFYFIPWEFHWKLYPAFNVADSGICIGVAILVLTWNIGRQPSHDATRSL